MIRFLFRASGFVLMAWAFAALVVDGSRSIAGGRLLQYSLGDSLSWLSGARFAAALQGVAAWPVPAQRLVLAVLAVPGWVAVGSVALALLAAGRPRAEAIRFSGPRR